MWVKQVWRGQNSLELAGGVGGGGAFARMTMNGDGGANGLDCSARGLCDYTTGVCKCFKGFYGERCEEISTLV